MFSLRFISILCDVISIHFLFFTTFLRTEWLFSKRERIEKRCRITTREKRGKRDGPHFVTWKSPWPTLKNSLLSVDILKGTRARTIEITFFHDRSVFERGALSFSLRVQHTLSWPTSLFCLSSFYSLRCQNLFHILNSEHSFLIMKNENYQVEN